MRRTLVLALMVLSATAIAASGEENPAVRSAKEDIRKGLGSQDAPMVERGVKALVSVNTAESFETLKSFIGAASRVGQDYYWLIVKGLAAFTSDEAVAEMLKFVVANAKQAIARDVLFWLQSNYAPSLVPMLIDLIERSTFPDDLRLMAIDHLGTLGEKSGIPALIAYWEQVDGKRGMEEHTQRVARAMGAITGESYGENLQNWKGWWEKNKDADLAASRDQPPEANGGQPAGGGGTVVERLDRGRQQEHNSIVQNGNQKVLVVKGAVDPKGFEPNYDHIEGILERMQIPHDVMTKQEAENDKVDFAKYAAVLVNCNHFRERCVNPAHGPGGAGSLRAMQCVPNENHMPFSDEFSPKSIDKFKRYVERGGFVFTEDWVLEELVEKAWPDFVKHGDYVLEDKTISVSPEPGATSHPYIQRLFASVPKKPEGGAAEGESYVPTFQEVKHEWKIDKDSPKILIQDDRRVQVLMQSNELVADPKSTKDRAIAVTFRPAGGPAGASTGGGKGGSGAGRGMVLHTLSHFGKQKSGEDEFALQNLLLNFLLEAFRNYMPPRK